ncbi:MAG: ATP-binding protein [Candidatus Methanomethylicia archaeon]
MIEIPFMDRIDEFRVLKSFVEHTPATPLYIYGPEGCGKTRLLKEFTNRLGRLADGKAVSVYIDALEGREIGKAILTPRFSSDILEVAYEVVKELQIPLGSALAKSISLFISRIFNKIYRRKLEGYSVFIAVDDVVKAIGLDDVERYVKWLYELQWKIMEEYKLNSLLFIVTTSEGESLDLVSRHRHSYIRFIWNLPIGDFEKLVQYLNPPESVSPDYLWRLFGGNPGRLIELATTYRWCIEDWLNTLEYHTVRRAVEEIIGRGLKDSLKDAIEDSDVFSLRVTPQTLELRNILIKHNLIIYKPNKSIADKEIPPDLELGIGKYWAWQIPAYKILLEKLLRSG